MQMESGRKVTKILCVINDEKSSPSCGNKDAVIKHELSNYDDALLYYPERAFEFTNAGKVLVKQSIADVGLTIWDAEVILAHYIDRLSLCGKRVLELGGGTCLAGVVCAKLGATVCTQDKEELTWIAQESFKMNDVSALSIGGLWGCECAAFIVAKHGYSDLIIMADVVYHKEHFAALFKTILACITEGGRIIISYEQRRADVSSFFHQFKEHFSIELLHETVIKRPDLHRESHIYLYEFHRRL